MSRTAKYFMRNLAWMVLMGMLLYFGLCVGNTYAQNVLLFCIILNACLSGIVFVTAARLEERRSSNTLPNVPHDFVWQAPLAVFTGYAIVLASYGWFFSAVLEIVSIMSVAFYFACLKDEHGKRSVMEACGDAASIDAERRELNQRITALVCYIEGKDKHTWSGLDRVFAGQQLAPMRAYEKVLSRRLELIQAHRISHRKPLNVIRLEQ